MKTVLNVNNMKSKMVQRLNKIRYRYVDFSMEKPEILSHQKLFREINSILTSLVKRMLSRNICEKSMRVHFRNFHTV